MLCYVHFKKVLNWYLLIYEKIKKWESITTKDSHQWSESTKSVERTKDFCLAFLTSSLNILLSVAISWLTKKKSIWLLDLSGAQMTGNYVACKNMYRLLSLIINNAQLLIYTWVLSWWDRIYFIYQQRSLIMIEKTLFNTKSVLLTQSVNSWRAGSWRGPPAF